MNLKALLTGELTLGFRMRSALLQRNYAANVTKDETIDITSVDRHPKYADDSEEFDDGFNLELKRNKSRLSSAHHNLLKGRRPYDIDTPLAYHHYGIDFKRRMLGRYGIEGSGVPPGVAWPTKEDIAEMKEYEKVAYPLSIKDSWAKIAETHAAEQAKIQAREDDIAAKLGKTLQWERELKAKIAKKEAEIKAVKERKERLVEEVRRHFGFRVDPRDERFKEMIEQKEMEDKKRKKAEKKKAREEQMMAKLLEGANIEGTSGANKATKSKSPKPKDLA